MHMAARKSFSKVENDFFIKKQKCVLTHGSATKYFVDEDPFLISM
jgi:hypothetical protein